MLEIIFNEVFCVRTSKGLLQKGAVEVIQKIIIKFLIGKLAKILFFHLYFYKLSLFIYFLEYLNHCNPYVFW